jgi:phage terminase large subunit
MTSQADLVAACKAFRAKYQDDPVGFAETFLRASLRDWQIAFAKDLASGTKLVSVRSGRGRGKTMGISVVVLWWMLTRFPQKTVVTAPASSTITDGLWPEIQLWANRLPDFLRLQLEITAERITLAGAPAESFVTAKTAREDRPESLQGIHAPHVLLLVDEASGVSEKAMEALTGSLAGDDRRMVLIANPTRTSGFFFESQKGEISRQWSRYQISALPVEDHDPGVQFFHCPCPGDEFFIANMRAKYGEDSSAFRVHVLGEFPKADDDTVIPLHLVSEAITRDVQGIKVPEIWGLDVARFGDDASALVRRRGNKVDPPARWRNLDLMQLCGRIVIAYEAADPKPAIILVDSIGLGAGVVDRLRELKLPVRGVNVSESPALGDTYLNLRAELWFKVRAWLEKRDVSLPNDEVLIGDLCAPRYGFGSSGKIKLESKDEIKKRGLPSPDAGDALALTFAEDASVLLHGRDYASEWNKPLKRRLATV